MTDYWIKGKQNQAVARELSRLGLWPKEIFGEFLDNDARTEPKNKLMEHLATEFYDGFDHI